MSLRRSHAVVRRARRRWPGRSLCPLAVLLVLLATTTVPAHASSSGAPPAVTYRPPVDAPITDHFRPPTGPYAAGNRGVDYATEPGTPVRAAAAGSVVFAGPVAGTLHVTVLHADGLRTSYSFLATVDVARGQEVVAGEHLGTTGPSLHFGVRHGDQYLDPESVLAGTRLEVRLVAEPPASAPTRLEGLALLPVALEAGMGGLGTLRAPGALDDVLTQVRDLHLGLDPSDPEFGVLGHYAWELSPLVREQRMIERFSAWWLVRHDCTPAEAEVAAPTERRIVVLVGGLGTTSERSSVDRLDTAALGYAEGDVLRFSYAGGRTPDRPPSGPLASIPATTYASADSQGDLIAAAGELRALLASVAARQPGVPIDVVAHSQGGVVTQVALTDLAPGPELPSEVDLVATLGSPHDGADLATAAAAISSSDRGAEALAALEDHLHLGLDPEAPSIQQLAESSPLMADLADAPLDPGVRLLTVGARGDLTVPAGHTRLPGATHATIDLAGRDAHTLLPGDAATTREVGLAMAGRPPACTTAPNVVLDLGVSETISYAEDLVGFTGYLLTR